MAAKSTSYMFDIKESIKAVKNRIDIAEKWISKHDSSHPEFMNYYKKKNELQIKLKALEDRKSSKGENVSGYEYSIPKYSNRN